MKTKVLIIGFVSLLSAGAIFHVSTGKCPLKALLDQGKTEVVNR